VRHPGADQKAGYGSSGEQPDECRGGSGRVCGQRHRQGEQDDRDGVVHDRFTFENGPEPFVEGRVPHERDHAGRVGRGADGAQQERAAPRHMA
jgi:hypothetical protein